MVKERLRQRVLQYQKDLNTSSRTSPYVQRALEAEDIKPNLGWWCEHCQLDFTARGYKVVVWPAAWSEPIARWERKCIKCGRYLRRYITDSHLDPYFRESKELKKLRITYRRDLLQPSDPGFRTLYGDPYKKIHKEEDMTERANFVKKPSITL